jgi:hypothetical protein
MFVFYSANPLFWQIFEAVVCSSESPCNTPMGSGTTGKVCDKLGRSFVGYDLKGYKYF